MPCFRMNTKNTWECVTLVSICLTRVRGGVTRVRLLVTRVSHADMAGATLFWARVYIYPQSTYSASHPHFPFWTLSILLVFISVVSPAFLIIFEVRPTFFTSISFFHHLILTCSFFDANGREVGLAHFFPLKWWLGKVKSCFESLNMLGILWH